MSPSAGGAGDGRRCLLCSKESLPSHLGSQVSILGQGVQAHELCIKFAKGIKNKKIVIGKTRLQVKLLCVVGDIKVISDRMLKPKVNRFKVML